MGPGRTQAHMVPSTAIAPVEIRRSEPYSTHRMPSIDEGVIEMERDSQDTAILPQDEDNLEQDVIRELEETFRAIKNRKMFRSFMEEEGFEDVLDHMLCLSESETVQMLGCNLMLHVVRIETSALRTVAAKDDGREFWRIRLSRQKFHDLKESLIQSNLIDILTLAMQSFPHNEIIQNHALTVLAKLVHPRLFQVRHEIQQLIRQAIYSLMPFARPVMTYLNSVHAFCKQDDEFCRAILYFDIHTALRLILCVHDNDSEITGSVCQLLFLLAGKCYDPMIRDKMMECLPDMLSILSPTRIWRNQSTTLLAACGVIWHMASTTDDAKRHIALKTKTLRYLIRLVLAYLHDKDLLIMACGTLCALSLSNDSCVLSKMSKSILLDALGPIWYKYHDVEMIIEPILIVLIRIDDHLGGMADRVGVGADTETSQQGADNIIWI